MNAQAFNIDRMNPATRFAWFMTVIFLLFGLGVLRDFIVLVLSKLYEIFIQQTPIRI